MFNFFTQIMNWDVIDKHGRYVGWPFDLTVDFNGAYPPVTGLTVQRGRFKKEYALFPWNQIHIVKNKNEEVLQLRVSLESIKYSTVIPNIAESTIRRNILDQQVVDTYNRKVVRVNDVHMLRVDSSFRLAHVDVGMRGMVRRLGWESVIDKFLRLFNPHSRYLSREGFIAWKYVQPLAVNPIVGKIPLSVAQSELDNIPPADLSEILEELDILHRTALFKSLDADIQGEILGELDERMRKELIAELDLKTAARVLEIMPADEVTDILQDLPRSERTRFLGSLSSRKAQKLSELLAHHEDSAGGHMTTEFIRLPQSLTVQEAIARIKEQGNVAETVYYAFIVDDERKLQGVVTFRTLLIEPLDAPIAEVMTERPIAVNVNDSAKEVAFVLDKYNLFAVPVVDAENVLQGIITVDDILSLVIEEAWGEKSGLM